MEHPPINDSLLNEHSSDVIRKKEDSFQSNWKCNKCFLTYSYCCCEYFSQHLFFDNGQPLLRHSSIEIFMHFKEFGRASNTGKICGICLPSDANLTIFGNHEQEEDLIKRLTDQPSLVIYPSSDAKPISEYRNFFIDESRLRKVNLCFIDSTWPQSHAMERKLPQNIPRAKIDEFVLAPSKFKNRKQSKTRSKVSTIEATIMALQCMGEDPAVLGRLENAFEYAVDALLQQGGKSPVYKNTVVPKNPIEIIRRKINEEGNDIEPCSKSISGPYTPPTIKKPMYCKCCGYTPKANEPSAFRNVGVRKKFIEDRQSRIDLMDYSEFEISAADVTNQMTVIKPESSNFTSYRVWRCKYCKNHFAQY